MTHNITLGIIGGSGLYDMEGLTNTEECAVDTPFGSPSDTIVTGQLHNQRVAFLARHGRGHHISPSEINYRANIYALKSLGVKRIVAVSACGSLRHDYAPGDIVIPDQLFDNTKNRVPTFFGGGVVAHIGSADPFCPALSLRVFQSVDQTRATVHNGATYITIEGPRFSTKAESNTFRAWGMDIIGMTTSPEAYLAREAQMCYAVMVHVTDYDVWHENEDPVTVEMVIQTVLKNTEIAQSALLNLTHALPPEAETGCQCANALTDAVMTRSGVIPEDTRAKLGLLLDKSLTSPI